MEKVFLNSFTKLLIFEMAFVVIVFLGLSLLKYFANPLFLEFMEIYNEYINTEISLGLVLD
ncbi:MAG: hypothetical protein J6V50_04555 [Clostridia bacterium]|nr:hypothetical protein [Clostridia bacterium]